MRAILISFGVIFVAELGDKSQLMALTFATRYRPVPVVVGISIATAVVHAFSVLVGRLASNVVPTRAITIVAGLAFLGFAVWTLRGDALSESDAERAARGHRSAVVAASIAFFLAELGDKTMLATITLATREGAFGTWLGSTLGMVASDAIAIWIGYQMGKRLPDRWIKLGAAGSFVVFGILLIAQGIAG